MLFWLKRFTHKISELSSCVGHSFYPLICFKIDFDTYPCRWLLLAAAFHVGAVQQNQRYPPLCCTLFLVLSSWIKHYPHFNLMTMYQKVHLFLVSVSNGSKQTHVIVADPDRKEEAWQKIFVFITRLQVYDNTAPDALWDYIITRKLFDILETKTKTKNVTTVTSMSMYFSYQDS